MTEEGFLPRSRKATTNAQAAVLMLLTETLVPYALCGDATLPYHGRAVESLGNDGA